MANTLSGILDTIGVTQGTLSGRLDSIDENQITSNMKSTKSLYRYTGIIDQVQHVEVTVDFNFSDTATVDTLTATYGLVDDDKVLLTGQTTTPSENGVYLLSGSTLTQVTYTDIETGNLVESLGEATDTSTVFYKLESDGTTWTSVTLTDGSVA